MNKRLDGILMRYFKLLPVCAILPLLCLFLPFLSVSGDKVRINGFGLIAHIFGVEGVMGASEGINVISLLIFVPAALVILASLVTVIFRKKSLLYALCTAYALNLISAILVVFLAKKIIDGAGFLSVGFLVKNLGAGFWLMMIFALTGLVISMRAAKINPGYIVLAALSVIWLIPILWIIMISFREEGGSYTSYFWPKKFTLKNYRVLLTDNSQFYFVRWFLNTLLVAVCSCGISTMIVLSTAYTLSRLRFSWRKGFMNISLILGMFPSFMSMIAVYYILKGLGLTQSLLALIMVYSGSSALNYYIVKGFFDTIPKALDEAAIIDGASRWKVFTRITIPLSKPVIIYTMLMAFLSPWGDYIFARVILGDNYSNYTIALGLYTMLEPANIARWYTRFAAGAVLISIPISALFISLQKYYVEGLSGSVKG